MALICAAVCTPATCLTTCPSFLKSKVGMDIMPKARAAGAAPLYRGQAGYSSRLDRDGDGVACE